MISDNRLFPGSLLYCEGRLKPVFRGKLHALGAAALCPYWFMMASSYLDSLQEFIALGLFFIGTLLCWSCSALYHCKSWEINEEILIQRLDHCAIFVCLACSFTPLSVLLYNQSVIYILFPSLLIIWSCSVYGIWHVFHKQEGIILLCVINITLMTPSFPFVAVYMTNIEKFLGILSIVFMSIGAVVFGKQVINPLPNIFGYHEVFHLCTLVAAFLVFSVYLSMSMDLSTRCDERSEVDQFIGRIASNIFGSHDICS